jgi:hypothetical protein
VAPARPGIPAERRCSPPCPKRHRWTEAADRIADATTRDPNSPTATSGFPERADTAAQRNADEDDDEDRGADEQ